MICRLPSMLGTPEVAIDPDVSVFRFTPTRRALTAPTKEGFVVPLCLDQLRDTGSSSISRRLFSPDHIRISDHSQQLFRPTTWIFPLSVSHPACDLGYKLSKLQPFTIQANDETLDVLVHGLAVRLVRFSTS